MLSGEEDRRSPGELRLQGLADLTTTLLGDSHSHHPLQQLSGKVHTCVFLSKVVHTCVFDEQQKCNV